MNSLSNPSPTSLARKLAAVGGISLLMQLLEAGVLLTIPADQLASRLELLLA